MNLRSLIHSFRKDRDSAKGVVWLEIGNGYRFSCRWLPNGRGGSHPVELTFHHEARGLHRAITDEDGRFIQFPGVVEGAWCEQLTWPFRPQMDFTFSWDTTEDRKRPVRLYWTVQPDGRYYGDDGDFGMDTDVEIVLYADLDRRGRFTAPFQFREKAKK